jgi:fibronectin type 3 domain-containing protein
MKTFLILFLTLLSSAMYSQVQLAWYNYPGGVAVATDASNNVYTANWDYNPGGDITLTKRDAAGNILWEVPYNNTDPTRHEVATWVETDGAGNILVSGTIRSGYSNPVNANSLLMKFDPSGNLLWRVVYETDFDGSSTRKCLVDSENNIYVLGLGNSGTGIVTKVKKFSPDGTALWSWFDNAGIGAPQNFKLTPDNQLLISGRGITGSINGYAKISLSGTSVWSLGGINSLTVGDAAGDSFGNTYLINGQYGASTSGSVVRKLSPSGAFILEKLNTMAGMRIEVGSDNNPVISGYPNSGSFGAAFMKFDVNGNMLWQNLDADGPGYALLAHAQMKLDGLNAAYLAAGTMSLMAVCKVNSDGTSAWTASTSSGYASCLDFGTDNSVFVTGGTTARFIQSGSTTVPAAPSNLTATASGSSVINLAWIDNSTDETNFVLQRSLASNSGFTTIATLPANTTSYVNSGLTGSTTYYYKVQATNSAGGSTWSNTASATTTAGPPNAPSNLTAAASGSSVINLSWTDNSADETSFVVERSLTSNSGFTTIATLAANTTTYVNSGLTGSTTYYYRVQATNAAGSSAWSNTASATTTGVLPNAPSNLTATAAGSSVINLAWTDNSTDETSFVLQRSLSEGSGFTTIATLPANTTTYVNSGLTGSTTYYYRVQAANAAGSSAWSNTANATTTGGLPAAPSNLVAKSGSCRAINLTWVDNSTNETSFQISRSLSSNGTYTNIATLPANTTAYTNTGLSLGKKYYYKVRSVNSTGTSGWSNTASATAKCTQSMMTEGEPNRAMVFPNPVKDGFFNLNLPSETEFPVVVQIYSLTGQKVMQKEVNDYNNTIETSNLKNGMYIVAVYINGEVQQFKLQVME